MHRISLAIFLAVALLAMLSDAAQAPDSKEEQQQQILSLVKEVQIQQAQIVANQANIDAKLANLAETLHTARIFSSRGR